MAPLSPLWKTNKVDDATTPIWDKRFLPTFSIPAGAGIWNVDPPGMAIIGIDYRRTSFSCSSSILDFLQQAEADDDAVPESVGPPTGVGCGQLE